jgi:cation diffusion facilitator CzcD-associated flavoprotein CzcO
VRLPDGARIAVVGAGPSGLVATKHAMDAGFDVTVFEAGDALGGQWDTAAPHSGVWPGMHTNTSRAMTAFSDFPAPAEHPLHPAAEQIRAYLEAYARAFGVDGRVRLGSRVADVRPGWTVDGEPFDAVIVASGRFRKPRLPAIAGDFRGEVIHSFDYPGADPFRDRAVLVYGNGISGLEIASDLAPQASSVVSAFRKPRYVIQKVVDGVSSDWQWYTLFGALERRRLPPDEWGRRQRERILRVAGNPADFGAPQPAEDLLLAGVSLCQDYLAQVRDGSIVCRPEIASIEGARVWFVDGSTLDVDAIVCATGFDVDIPYLSQSVLGPDLALYQRTFHPDVPGLGVIGQFLAQGPYFPLLELQARWIVAVWSGDATLPPARVMRDVISQPRPPLDAHNALALTLSEELGVSPEPTDWPTLCEPLMFGPLLPPRYRLSGPGASPDASARFTEQLAASPRAPVDPADIETLPHLGSVRPKRSTVPGACDMSYTVSFDTVSTVGLESSPFADALAGLRANEARYFKNKYDHDFTVEPASDAEATIEWVHRILKEERDLVISSRPLEATAFQVENIRMAYVFYESGLSVNVMYTMDGPEKRAVGFKLSDGMDVPAELESRFKFARQRSKLAGTIRGSYFVIKGEY